MKVKQHSQIFFAGKKTTQRLGQLEEEVWSMCLQNLNIKHPFIVINFLAGGTFFLNSYATLSYISTCIFHSISTSIFINKLGQLEEEVWDPCLQNIKIKKF